MRAFARTLATCVVATLLLAVPASAAAPEAGAAGNCSVRGKERSLGASYVLKLSTRRVTCANARDFVKRYHRCRFRNGGRKGRCTRLSRFRCEERRFNRIDISYDANVLCTRGAKRIRHTYTQLT